MSWSQQHRRMKSIFAFALLIGILSMTSAFSEAADKSSSSSLIRQRQQQQQQQGGFDEDFSCNVQADTCTLKGNGQCDNANAEANCADGDCWDCDVCRQNYDFDCHSCLQQTGCVWCPGDARCYNSVYYDIDGASCNFDNQIYYATTTDDTCNVPGDVNYFDDPLFSAQRWVYDMINVQAVWEKGYLGTGVRVRVNDNGVESTHPEFDSRFDRPGSCDNPDIPANEFEQNSSSGAHHGTSVAGIIGGSANNGLCSVGVAPEVTLSACYALDATTRILAEKLDSFDISQNSFGTDGCAARQSNRKRTLQDTSCPFVTSAVVCDSCNFSSRPLSDQCEGMIMSHCRSNFENDEAACLEFLDLLLVQNGQCDLNTLSTEDLEDLTSGILNGRDGKGVIYVFASGDAFDGGDDTNFQGFTNSRLVISVGAVGKDGSHASYATPGASIFVSGPGGDSESHSNHITAGLDGACTNAGQGTSFSCPVVSGVIALMLQANPALTWRDVQGILATTSKRVENDPDDGTDQVNGAGLWHSNLYGFGIVDAFAAVEAAETWTSYGREKQIIGESGILDLPLSDLSKTSSNIQIPLEGNEGVVAEAVEILLDMRHASRGNLEISLTSPSGMKSVLTPGGRPDDAVLGTDDRWKLLTVRHWNESPVGEWKLEVVDTKEGNDSPECADMVWTLPNNSQGIACDYISRAGWCIDGVENPNGDINGQLFNFLFNSADADGNTAGDACCSCGGGTHPDNVVEELRQWRLVIYGRSDEDMSVESPVLPSGCTGVGNELRCPRNSAFRYDGDTWTLGIDVTCPVDAVAESGFTAATHEGNCQCQTRGLMGPDGISREIDCDCISCPAGGGHPFSYTCTSPIVGECRSFSCAGECGDGTGLTIGVLPTSSPQPTPSPDSGNAEVPSMTIFLEPDAAPEDASGASRQLLLPLSYGMMMVWWMVTGFWILGQ